MKRVIVIGCPGSGKSTFAAALHNKTEIPLYHLDMMYWNADRTTVEREVFLARLGEVLERDEWIIDGNYQSTMEMRIKECDKIILLDYPTEVCIQGAVSRIGMGRGDIPWTESKLDSQFEKEIREFKTKRLPQIYLLLDKYSGEKSVTVLRSREEADEYVESIKITRLQI
jgi:adenylate kinase family enzyme